MLGWPVTPEERVAPREAKSPELYVAKLSPAYNDAHGVAMEVYHPDAVSIPSGLAWTRT
jgi:hypothetical protein